MDEEAISGINPHAVSGFAQAASYYSRGRPGYPEALAEWLRGPIALGPGKMLIELGAGTGQCTLLLIHTGAHVLAVEPAAQMRSQFLSAYPEGRIVAGSAQAIPAPSASADAVVCAQSFHWFAQEASLAEIARVLKTQGVLALIWNVPDERVDWVADICEILDPVERTAPCQYKRGTWQKVFPDRRFTSLQRAEFLHWHRGSPEEVIIQRAASLSYVANLEAAHREAIIDQLRGFIRSHPALTNRLMIDFPYRTFAYHCQRTDASP